MKREGFGLKGITDSGKDIYFKSRILPRSKEQRGRILQK
jgi:hypothetical protein